jgi:hypothetical protein
MKIELIKPFLLEQLTSPIDSNKSIVCVSHIASVTQNCFAVVHCQVVDDKKSSESAGISKVRCSLLSVFVNRSHGEVAFFPSSHSRYATISFLISSNAQQRR